MVKKKAKMENDPQKDQEALPEELVEIVVKFQFLCLLVIIFMTELPYINFGSHWIHPSATGSFFIFSNMALLTIRINSLKSYLIQILS